MDLNATLPELVFDHKLFVDRLTIFLGASGSGKSTVMVHVLSAIKAYVDQIIVISPTDRQNHTYDCGMVPAPCIWYEITDKLLNDIWDRQNALVNVYTRANNLNILRQLFNKIPNNGENKSAIDGIGKKLLEYKTSDNNSIPIEEMEANCNKLITLIYKKSIGKFRGELINMHLTEEEKFTLKFFDLNPRLVLIFDDCTEQLKKFKSHPVIQKLFYQGRWAHITCLMACHTDKALEPELKKNAFITIFTEETSAHSYISRISNDFTKEGKVKACAACNVAFTPLLKHQKLAFVREKGQYYKFTADIHKGFKFGNEHIWKYCDSIQAQPGASNINNKFINGFHI